MCMYMYMFMYRVEFKQLYMYRAHSCLYMRFTCVRTCTCTVVPVCMKVETEFLFVHSLPANVRSFVIIRTITYMLLVRKAHTANLYLSLHYGIYYPLRFRTRNTCIHTHTHIHTKYLENGYLK